MHDIRVADPDGLVGLAPTAVSAWAAAVLDGESAGPAAVSVTFLGEAEMRRLNREALGRDDATDVIAFRLDHPGMLAGDVYVCPAVAARSCTDSETAIEEELARLVVHGVLHVLDHDHPDAAGEREASTMWRLQEAYVRRLRGEVVHP
jgi:probable rRNA maturation factor